MSEGRGEKGDVSGCPTQILPQILPDGLTGNLQDHHGRVQLPQGLDGRDVQSDDVGGVDSCRRGAEGVRALQHTIMAWIEGVWMVQALCSSCGVGGGGLAALLPKAMGQIRSMCLSFEH